MAEIGLCRCRMYAATSSAETIATSPHLLMSTLDRSASKPKREAKPNPSYRQRIPNPPPACTPACRCPVLRIVGNPRIRWIDCLSSAFATLLFVPSACTSFPRRRRHSDPQAAGEHYKRCNGMLQQNVAHLYVFLMYVILSQLVR